MRLVTRLWIGLVILIILSPLGLLVPEHYRAGAAWGEWGLDEIQELVGYLPQGLKGLAERWKAPVPDYAFSGGEEAGLAKLSVAYIFSAVIGVAAVALVIVVIGKVLVRKE